MTFNQRTFEEPPSLQQLDAIRESGFRPNIVACFIHNKEILFLYKEEYNLWMLPQGGIANQEQPLAALQREMTEELGEEFVSNTAIDTAVYVGNNVIEFPPRNRGNKDLETDTGEDVFMVGKFYFFYAVESPKEAISMKKTEFDNSQWLAFNEAVVLASKVYQRGKKRITIKALFELREKGLL